MLTRGSSIGGNLLYFRMTYNSLFSVSHKFFLRSKSQPCYHENWRGWERTKLWLIPDFLICFIKYVGRIWWIGIFRVNLVEDLRTVYVIEEAVSPIGGIGGIGTEWAVDIDFWPVWKQHGNVERELFITEGCKWLVPLITHIETNDSIGANLKKSSFN